MTVPKRLYYEQPVYHIISRGNNRQYILQNDGDKKSFLETLSRYKARYSFKLYAFVLMNNHFHLIIKTCPKHNISRVMQGILLSYSNKFRNKYDYIGHVWQGRFVSRVILSDAHMLRNINYIHNNPVRAKTTKASTDYPWSSSCSYLGATNLKIKNKITIDLLGQDTLDRSH